MRTSLLIAAGLVLALACSGTRAQDDKEPEIITRLKKAKVDGPFALAAALLSISAVRADDWPQWMGPQRDDVWRETGILEKFPKEGPKVLWRYKVHWGYSGPSVAGGLVYLMDYETASRVRSLSVPF